MSNALTPTLPLLLTAALFLVLGGCVWAGPAGPSHWSWGPGFHHAPVWTTGHRPAHFHHPPARRPRHDPRPPHRPDHGPRVEHPKPAPGPSVKAPHHHHQAKAPGRDGHGRRRPHENR